MGRTHRFSPAAWLLLQTGLQIFILQGAILYQLDLT